MTKWILIIYISGGLGGASMKVIGDFTTEAKCKEALQRTTQLSSYLRTTCIEVVTYAP